MSLATLRYMMQRSFMRKMFVAWQIQSCSSRIRASEIGSIRFATGSQSQFSHLTPYPIVSFIHLSRRLDRSFSEGCHLLFKMRRIASGDTSKRCAKTEVVNFSGAVAWRCRMPSRRLERASSEDSNLPWISHSVLLFESSRHLISALAHVQRFAKSWMRRIQLRFFGFLDVLEGCVSVAGRIASKAEEVLSLEFGESVFLPFRFTLSGVWW